MSWFLPSTRCAHSLQSVLLKRQSQTPAHWNKLIFLRNLKGPAASRTKSVPVSAAQPEYSGQLDVNGVELSGVIQKELHLEASESYLSYAMSVIVGRALPDVRDGLKPVHRRILFAMHELGLSSNKPFRKCARVVGEVLGKFHPHGDSAVYDSLVRMAQDFSLRSPLVNGHGNFGSVDADPPAAMRYTECRLQPLAEAMLLADIEFDTVNFAPNFDSSVSEPTVLPSRLPNLLINGSQGIAVGMATNIPPHNLSEIVDALIALIKNPNITIFQLLEYCPGPDFPTGGAILSPDGVSNAYKTGNGSIIVRGKTSVEEIKGKNSKTNIIISELPYQANKAALVEKIASLANNKVVDGISDIRDESDRNGMRVVIELKKSASPKVVLNSLYKHTSLQGRFNCNMVGLVDNEPQTLNFKQFLQTFLDFRCQVLTRRAQFKLKKAEERHHLVQGFLTALQRMDLLVSEIRSSKDSQEAIASLSDGFGLSQVQSEAVLAMPLRRLTSLESQKLEEEHRKLSHEISDLKSLLSSREKLLQTIETESLQLKKQFGTPRRTLIDQESESADLREEDLVPNDNILVVVSEKGYVKRMAVDSLSQQSRNTRGKSGAKFRSDDDFKQCLVCRAHDRVLLFSTKGVVYTLRGFQIPEVGRTAMGTPLPQILPLEAEEKITSILPVPAVIKKARGDSELAADLFSDSGSDSEALLATGGAAGRGQLSLVMLTRMGWMKRVALDAFDMARKTGLLAITLGEGDELLWVGSAGEEDSVILGTEKGRVMRCDLSQIRQTGRNSRGVGAISLTKGDSLAAMDVLPAGSNESKESGPWILVVTAGGLGKRVPSSLVRTVKRKGKGVLVCKLTENDTVKGLCVVGANPDEEIVVGSHEGILNRFRISDIPIQGRSAKGVRLMKLSENDRVKSSTLIPESALELTNGTPLVSVTVNPADVVSDSDSDDAEIEDEDVESE